MRNIAVICEYNPFHHGHRIQAELIRAKFPGCRIVSVMSGNIVQRGTTAILPKHLRAEAAVKCGIDLVLELPYPYSGAGAELFAAGAVRLIASLGCIDVLCFGSENGNLESLYEAAGNLSSVEYLKEYEHLKAGGGAESRISLSEKAYLNVFGSGFPVLPNDILAVEYLKAMKKYAPDITPFTYAREKGFSATESRSALAAGDYEKLKTLVPEEAFRLYQSYGGCDSFAKAESAVLSFLRLSKADLSGCSCAGGGIYQLLKNKANEVSSFDELLAACSGKRYTDANIRRAIISVMLGTTPEMLSKKPLFTDVLASSNAGRKLLSEMRKTAKIAIFTKPAHYRNRSDEEITQFERNLDADRLYLLTSHKKESPAQLLKKMPYIEAHE